MKPIAIVQWFRWLWRQFGVFPPASDLRNPVEAQVLRIADTYYLQLRTVGGSWVFCQGWHRGAPGHYNYQFSTAMNPFALVQHTLPKVQDQLDRPTLSPETIAHGIRNTPRTPTRCDQILTLEDIAAMPKPTWWTGPV